MLFVSLETDYENVWKQVMWVAYNANVLSLDFIFVNRRKGYHIQSLTAVIFAMSFRFFLSIFDRCILVADKHWLACAPILNSKLSIEQIQYYLNSLTMTSLVLIKYSFLIDVAKCRFHQAVSVTEVRLKLIQWVDVMHRWQTNKIMPHFEPIYHSICKCDKSYPNCGKVHSKVYWFARSLIFRIKLIYT